METMIQWSWYAVALLVDCCS